MDVVVRVFAAWRDVVGKDQVKVTGLARSATVGDVRKRLSADWPALEGLPAAAAVDHRFATDEATLREAQVVAFVPPVSGG